MIATFAVTAAGRSAAAELSHALGDTREFALTDVAEAWRSCDGLVFFLAAGAVVRTIAPLLFDKSSDPGVVCVDEARRFAVSLAGGHEGGANELALRVAAALGAEPVVTTATDATGIPGLDILGWPVEGAVAAVTRAIIDGDPVQLSSSERWPLPALPGNVADVGDHVIVLTDRLLSAQPRTVTLRPPSLVIGVGASRGASADEISALIDSSLEVAALSPASVRSLATIDLKADEPGILEVARRRGWTVFTYDAQTLAGIEVPNPSDVVDAEVGTPSVAEAAALAGSGRAELVVTKQKSAAATVAVARHAPRGRLALIGLGPGARDLLTPRAVSELRRAAVVVGLDQYVTQVRDLLRPGTRVLESGLGQEEERARTAVDEARAGHAVALLGSGDAGIYAMASPALAVAGADIDVVAVPGISAAVAAAAALGAPLGHDHAYISLSDLHTPWDAIERRVRAAAAGDFTVAFYNPRSRGRDWQLPRALEILAESRPPRTPVGLVREVSRSDERVLLTTLAEIDVELVDMLTVVVVGSSTTALVAGRMVTPRGYRWLG